MSELTYRFELEDVEHELPGKYEVCPRCDGRGAHVNPAIDGNGLTSEDFEDEDFREGYFAGRYDVTCYDCKGLRVVMTPDVARLTDAQKELLEEHEEQLASEAADYASEERLRRMEDGWR